MQICSVEWVERSGTHQCHAPANVDGFRCAPPILRHPADAAVPFILGQRAAGVAGFQGLSLLLADRFAEANIYLAWKI